MQHFRGLPGSERSVVRRNQAVSGVVVHVVGVKVLQLVTGAGLRVGGGEGRGLPPVRK